MVLEVVSEPAMIASPPGGEKFAQQDTGLIYNIPHTVANDFDDRRPLHRNIILVHLK